MAKELVVNRQANYFILQVQFLIGIFTVFTVFSKHTHTHTHIGTHTQQIVNVNFTPKVAICIVRKNNRCIVISRTHSAIFFLNVGNRSPLLQLKQVICHHHSTFLYFPFNKTDTLSHSILKAIQHYLLTHFR